MFNKFNKFNKSLKKITFAKVTLVIIFILVASGFRVLDHHFRWRIHEGDPYLWIKPCNRSTVFNYNSTDASDLLNNSAYPSIVSAIQSIASDINQIYGSYLKLEVYPADPTNPGLDSHFTPELAQQRTITVCEEDMFLASGNSRWKVESDKIVGCEIKYNPSKNQDVREFLATVTHEIGHCLGLGHPQEITDAIMSYFNGGDVYRMQIDDKIGIRYLFPAYVVDGEVIDHKEHNSLGLSCSFRK